MAFLDRSKDVDGHTLLIPAKHYKSIIDIDMRTYGKVMKTVKRVSEHYVRNCSYDGVNLLNASEEEAGQSAPHFHVHIIPRKQNNGINAWPSMSKSSTSEDIHKLLML